MAHRVGHSAPSNGPFNSVLDAFLENARRHPQAPAILFGDRTLSYEALRRRAAEIRHSLVAAGVVRGSVVALFQSREPDAVAAQIGVLGAGAAFVALDPLDPLQHSLAVIRTAGAKHLITSSQFASRFSSLELAVITIDESPARVIEDSPPVVPEAQQSMYFLTTSGSTGEPKTVCASHASVVSCLGCLTDLFALSAGDVYAHTSRFAFAVGIRQTFLPLCNGATILLADDDARRDPRRLLDLMGARKATVWDTVPSFLSASLDLIAQCSPSTATDLADHVPATVIVTGEALHTHVAVRFRELLGGRRAFFNVYAQTESIGALCAYEIGAVVSDSGDYLPVGHPLPDVDVSIAPESGGSNIGEICFSGRRYANTAALHTGDRGEFDAAGRLRVLGRIDDCVQIRGNRVDLASLESALVKLDAVHEAAVVHRDNAQGGRLLAFVVASESGPGVSGLRKALNESLPDFMVPAQFFEVTELPRSANGKVDRQALLREQTSKPVVDEEGICDGDLIRRLGDIWASVLEIKNPAPDASLSELGASSLDLVRLCVLLERALHVPVTLRQLQRANSIRGLARAVASGGRDTGYCIELRPGNASCPIFMLPGVGGHTYSLVPLANKLDCGQRIYGVQLPGVNEGEPIVSQLPEMAALIVADIRQRHPHGPYVLVGHSFGGLVALEVAHQLHTCSATVERLIVIDTLLRDAARAPLPAVRRAGVHMRRMSDMRAAEVAHYLFKLLRQRFTGAHKADLYNAAQTPDKTLNERLKKFEQACFRAQRTYRTPAYTGAVDLVQAAPRPWTELYDMAPALGWRDVTERLTVHETEGSHLELLREPQLDSLSQIVNRVLGQAG